MIGGLDLASGSQRAGRDKPGTDKPGTDDLGSPQPTAPAARSAPPPPKGQRDAQEHRPPHAPPRRAGRSRAQQDAVPGLVASAAAELRRDRPERPGADVRW